MDDDQPHPPIYSDHRINLFVAKSRKELEAQQDSHWARELAEGSVSPAEWAYRLRKLATRTRNWAAIPCDTCGKPGAKPLYVFGSPAGVVGYIEDVLGVAVPGGRERLLESHEYAKALPIAREWPGLMDGPGCSARVLVFCVAHAPDGEVRIEPGYEEAFDTFHREAAPGT